MTDEPLVYCGAAWVLLAALLVGIVIGLAGLWRLSR